MWNPLGLTRNCFSALTMSAIVFVGITGCGGSSLVEEPETTSPLPDDSMLVPLGSGEEPTAGRSLEKR